MDQESTPEISPDTVPVKSPDSAIETSAAPDIRALNERIGHASQFVDLLRMELGKVIVGQSGMVDRLLIGLLGNGHVLLEGVPGLAKTLAIKSLSESISADFSRIQFTPDLLPADLIGTMIYNQKSESFSVKKGPIFANFVLADEINRAPAKVQSALLEAMQERQVTIGPDSYPLPEPFLVLATQNPVEQEGTYPLPEAQVDRFLLKVVIGYPSKSEEQQIVRANLTPGGLPKPSQVINPEDIVEARKLVNEIYLDEKIERYIVDLVFATREPAQYDMGHLTQLINFGASPRASIGLGVASKAHAFLNHRGYVTPEDVRAIALDVLRHRIGLTFEAEAENISAEQIVTEIMDNVQVP
ncbi:MAG TPA: ATPase [Flavobacteriales bacterium]|nr:ATPase [Flavobacteriales bacterium]|tara:strand:+ start:3022 stop:4092 length:1071 start_codon:yes stop_codon:yes gene_type:complete